MPNLLYKISWRLKLLKRTLKLVMFHNFDPRSILFALREIFSTHPSSFIHPCERIDENDSMILMCFETS
ncbi:MAG: hypothetical protein ABDH53_09655 [Pseudothermotoga sp.]